MDSVSEKISRILDRIAMVGLILSIIKIPAFKKDSRFRSGQLSNQVNCLWKTIGYMPTRAPNAEIQLDGDRVRCDSLCDIDLVVAFCTIRCPLPHLVRAD
jgi:hypothetical protein